MPQNRRASDLPLLRRLMSVGLLALPSALLGCAANADGVDAQAPAAVETTEPETRDPVRDLGYRLDWIGYAAVAERGQIQYFDAYEDILLAHDDRNVLSVLETGTGAVRWTKDLGADLTRFVGNLRIDGTIIPRVDEEDVVVSVSQGQLFAHSAATGELLARQDLALLVNTEPVVIDGMAIFGSPTGVVLGHNLRTGYQLWGYQLQGPITARPAVVDGAAGVVSQGGSVVLLDPLAGKTYGRVAQVYGGLANDPVASDSALYVASLDQSIYAFSAESARQLWRVRTETPIRAQPTLHEGVLYVAVPRRGLLALDANSGDEIWVSPDLIGEVIATRGDALVVWTGEELVTLDRQRGDVLARAAMPGVSHLEVDAFVDGNIYTISERGGEVRKYIPSY